jgi:hypothetical protein
MLSKGRVGQAHDSVVLFLTHVFEDEVSAAYRRLDQQCRRRWDVRILFDKKGTYPDTDPAGVGGAVGYDFTGTETTSTRHFHDPKIVSPVAGNMDVPVLDFYRAFPGYAHYWVVEFDVRFTGRWSYLFNCFRRSKADLLATTMFDYEDYPGWHWWYTLTPPTGEKVDVRDLVRAFLPIYRASNRALEHLGSAYSRGWQGHYEATVATILRRNGMMLEDIGGNGRFIDPRNRSRFYTNDPKTVTLSPGTLVWRPIRQSPGRRKRTLWHPVKSGVVQQIGYETPGPEARVESRDSRPDHRADGRTSGLEAGAGR